MINEVHRQEISFQRGLDQGETNEHGRHGKTTAMGIAQTEQEEK